MVKELGGTPNTLEFIYKILHIYSYMLNFIHFQTVLHLMQYIYRDNFFSLQTVFELQF